MDPDPADLLGPGTISEKRSDKTGAAGLRPPWVVGSKMFLNRFIILPSVALDPFSEPYSEGCKLEFSRAL